MFFFAKKEPTNFCSAVADYPATEAQKFLLLFQEEALSWFTKVSADGG